MPLLRHWRRTGMPVLRHCIPKHKLSNANYTLDILEAAWVVEQCKVEGGLSSEHCASIARRFVAYCLACKIVRSLLRA